LFSDFSSELSQITIYGILSKICGNTKFGGHIWHNFGHILNSNQQYLISSHIDTPYFGYDTLGWYFCDAGFSDDNAKINVEEIFKLMSPHTEVKAI